MEVKQFTLDNTDVVAAMAARVWGKEQGAHGTEMASLFSQHLTRYSLYSRDLALPTEDKKGLQAIAFAWLPGDMNDAVSWLWSQHPNLTDEEQQTLLSNERYLTRTDAELQSKMLPNSAKLSFYISQKPGYGTLVLNALIERLWERGIEWLYFWTDCTCSWEYYSKHGYEQIGNDSGYDELISEINSHDFNPVQLVRPQHRTYRAYHHLLVQADTQPSYLHLSCSYYSRCHRYKPVLKKRDASRYKLI